MFYFLDSYCSLFKHSLSFGLIALLWEFCVLETRLLSLRLGRRVTTLELLSCLLATMNFFYNFNGQEKDRSKFTANTHRRAEILNMCAMGSENSVAHVQRCGELIFRASSAYTLGSTARLKKPADTKEIAGMKTDMASVKNDVAFVKKKQSKEILQAVTRVNEVVDQVRFGKIYTWVFN